MELLNILSIELIENQGEVIRNGLGVDSFSKYKFGLFVSRCCRLVTSECNFIKAQMADS